MIDKVKNENVINVRCIKCGREFIIKKGRIEQKKIKRAKKIIRRTDIRGTDTPNHDKIMKEQERIIKQHKRIQQQLDMVRKLNAIKKPKKP